MTANQYPCPADWERRAIRITIECAAPADGDTDFVTLRGWMVIRSDSPDDPELGRIWLDGDEESSTIIDGRYDPEDFNLADAEIISRVLDHIQGYPLGSMQGHRQ